MFRRLLLTFIVLPSLVFSQVLFNEAYGKYSPKGPEGLPTFLFTIPFNGPESTDRITPAVQACIYLRNGFGSRVKKEEATCNLARILQRPKSLIEMKREPRRYYDAPGYGYEIFSYKPPGVGKEIFRFVVEWNGQEVDVTCVLETTPYQH